jgi:hypothetical protein
MPTALNSRIIGFTRPRSSALCAVHAGDSHGGVQNTVPSTIQPWLSITAASLWLVR